MASQFFKGMQFDQVTAILGNPFARIETAEGDICLYSTPGGDLQIHTIGFNRGVAFDYGESLY